MKRLPPFCSSDDLVIPHIPDNVRVALEDISPDALETIETLGVPCSWRITFEANEALELSERCSDWISAVDELPIGEACVIARDPLPKVEGAFQEWVITAHGAVVLCSRLITESASFYNSNYSAFLVFVTSFRRAWDASREDQYQLISMLGSADPFAFEADGAWPQLYGEMVFGIDASYEETDKIRRVALLR